jgi:hypothetical protein
MRFYTGSTRKLSFVRELEKNHIGRVNHPESRFTPFIDGLFIGGTLGFKAQVKQWVALGKKHGKPVHYGRAGVHHRIHDAYLAGCDSADSAFPLWEKNRFMRFLTWIKQGKYDPDSYKQLCFDY